MFHCARCKTSFNPTVAASAGNCPRCRSREGVAAPLHFRIFEPSAIKVAGAKTQVEVAEAPAAGFPTPPGG